MAIVKCQFGHFYDSKRNEECPYCGKLRNAIPQDEQLNEQLTSYVENRTDMSDDRLTEAYGENVSDFERTFGVYLEDGNILTAGWLVCTEGLERGKSIPIHTGRNFAGQGFDMDIELPSDAVTGKGVQFSVVYDPKGITFYLLPGDALIYLNEKAVYAQEVLAEGDELSVGGCRYLFVPFCKEGREWK